jgi:hypothetical protein
VRVAAEVEVDLETGKARVMDLRMAAYAGRVVHPTYAELQVEGNAAFVNAERPMEALRKTVHGPPARKECLSRKRLPQCRASDASCSASL